MAAPFNHLPNIFIFYVISATIFGGARGGGVTNPVAHGAVGDGIANDWAALDAAFSSVNPGDTAEAAAFKTSTLNWADPGTTRANASVVALDGGRVKLGASSSTVDVVFDVNGYYR